MGTRFRAAFSRLVATLCRQPRLCHRAGRSPRGREVRVALVPRFPFLVHYEITAAEIVILSVVHARSRYRPWRTRLPNP